MSTLVTIASGDVITNSRADINSNFSALNTDKEEVSNKSTDTALGSSNTLYPSQNAVKTYVDTQTGTSDSIVTLVPMPNFLSKGSTLDGPVINVNTTMSVGQIFVPIGITVNKISFYVDGVTVAGTVKLALYSEDGLTKVFEVTTASISSTGVKTTSLSAATLVAPGVYYLALLPVGTTNIVVRVFIEETTTTGLASTVTSEPVLCGTVTVTASTIPSTITPTTITFSGSTTLYSRWDN